MWFWKLGRARDDLKACITLRSLQGLIQIWLLHAKLFAAEDKPSCVLALSHLNRDIHEESAPSHLERSAPVRSNSQSIHLGGSFTEAPKRATGHCDHCLLFLPLSKRNPLPYSDLRTPFPPLSTLCDFHFCERSPLPFPRVVFQFYDPTRPTENERSWISKPSLCRFSSDCSIEEGFWSKALQMAWGTLSVNVQLKFETNQRRTNPSGYSGKQDQYTFELLVRDSQQGDGGTYACVAKNEYGEHRGEVTLDVLEPTSSPRGVRITEITSRSTRVSWQPPLPSNSPVLKYHVRYWKNGGVSGKQLHQVVLGGSETSTYLEGLHPGTSYSVQVLAENGVGLSEPSQLRHVQTKEEAPSGAPTDVHAHAIGSKQIEVSWKPPPSESWHGVLKGYYLGYKVSSSPLAYVYHTTTEPTGRRFRIKGLQKSTLYSIVVKAYNSMGSGAESQPIEVKTRESDPPYPPSFVISDVTSGSALVQMKSEEMSPVLQYIVEYRRQGEEWNPVHVPRDKSSFQLSRLDNCMTYEVRLAAYNEHGRGEFSSTLAFTTTERETNIGFRSSEEDIPFYFRHYFVLPVAASVVVIVTTVVFAWVCYKRVVFRQHRHLVLQQQLAGHLPEGQLTLHRDGYIRPPTYSPPSNRRGVVVSTSIVGILNPEDGYDAPWDVKKQQQQQQQQLAIEDSGVRQNLVERDN
ncbi:Down syndrome cell adhesion molecule [Araneus ventricosus]|uniref:Down syndrome cell adhesion molecule n=1 Tax=Araneus ventricosus TaxID=182803 RepID=A0A4Y2G4N1_ARAVE|nr:Down syndrome cell adhesion molecule [Araneus ventricosus]